MNNFLSKSFSLNPALLLHVLMGYFLITLLLFFGCWIKLYFSIPMIALTLISYNQWVKVCFNKIPTVFVSYQTVLILLVVSCFSLLLVGFGGVFEQKFDLFYRSNIVFSKLVFNDWPVIEQEDKFHFLSYYLGYFLLPAFLCKLIGIQFFLWIEYFINSVLLFAILCLFYVRFKHFKFLLFLLPSGIYWLVERYLFSYNTGFRYFNFLNVLAHGPQQLFPALFGLVIFLLLDKSILQKSYVFLLGILFFWSPFAVVGLSVLFLKFIFQTKFTFLNGLGILFASMFLLFYVGKDASIYFQLIDFSSVGLNYILFVFLDVMVVLLVCKPKFDLTFLFVVLFLLLLPFLHFGIYNDLLTKASIPCVIYFYYWNLSHVKFQVGRLITMIFFLVYSITSINHFLNLSKFYQGDKNILCSYRNKKFSDFSTMGPEIQNQYYSNIHSWFGTYLLRK